MPAASVDGVSVSLDNDMVVNGVDKDVHMVEVTRD